MLDINDLDPLYFVDDDDVDKELFEPVFRSAQEADCMVGYFTSGALSELARSLSYFLQSTETPIRFLVSPNLEEKDLLAFKKALDSDENLIPHLFPDFELNEDSLRSRCVEALAFLVATGRLVFRLSLKKGGLWHTKCWMFKTEQGWAAIHGSGNATKGGLVANTEQLAFDRDWDGDKSYKTVSKIRNKFQSTWDGYGKDIETVDLNSQSVAFLQSISEQVRKIEQWPNYLAEKLVEESVIGEHTPQTLSVPNWLNYREGAFSHQGEAVDSWLNERGGILSIATGGGKTLTSLVTASLMCEELQSLLLVIAVPTNPLVDQWCEDVREFHVEPLNTIGMSKKQLRPELRKRLRNLRDGYSRAEVVVITHDALKSDLMDTLGNNTMGVPMMLIGDEVHNLGSAGFISSPPEFFEYRLGLSATWERQFDEEGTEALLSFFGPVVYDFPLEEAIGKCLVPFEYHVRRVVLDAEEQEKWADLTYQIGKLSYAADLADGNPDRERWKLKCLERRRLVETANGKITSFAACLPQSRADISRSLIFCTDKDPEQLEAVNELLSRRLVNFHQVTGEETRKKSLLRKIITSFNTGEIQVLTSKKVLDEGFNVPQTETAYLLANNTVRRTWIQRLGRILRLSPQTEKSKAYVYDFVVVPQREEGGGDSDLRSLIKGEMTRVGFFARLSSNGLEKGGALNLIDELQTALEGTE